MFCPKCGRELTNESIFCPTCGMRIQQTQPDMNNQPQAIPPYQNYAQGYQPYGQQQYSPVSPEEELMRQLIGDNSHYYLSQFAAIQAGMPTKFNIPSFFFNVLHMIYRGMWKTAIKRFIGPQILSLLMMISLTVGIFNQSIPLFVIAIAGSFIAGIWHLVVSIVTAIQFNKLYKQYLEELIAEKHLMENPQAVVEVSKKHARTHPGLVAAVYGGLFVIYLIFELVFAIGAMQLASSNLPPFDFSSINAEIEQENAQIGDGIDFIKNSKFLPYDDKTIGEGFESFFSSTKWEAQGSENGETYVSFTGEVADAEAPIKIQIDFTVFNNGEFEVSRWSADSAELPMEQINDLLDAVFGKE